MGRLKVAIIGAGQVAQVSHIPSYQQLNKRVEVIGICDVNLEVAKKVADQFQIPNYFTSYQEMFKHINPDAVSICVPNKYHFEATVYALEKGCHVLCEKPPALTIEQTMQMIDTARKHNRLLTFNFHFRHSHEVKTLKQKIKSKEFGDLYSARVQAIRRRGIPGWGSFTNKEIQGGGPLIDIGIHMLDTALYLMDYPELDYVCATSHQRIGNRKGIGLMGEWDPEKFSVEDSVFGFIKFKSGESINLETAFALNIKEARIQNVHIFGERAGASAFPLEIYGEDELNLINIQYPFENIVDRHLLSITNFINACLGEEQLVCSAEQGLYIQKVVNSLYRSAETGQPIYIK